MEGQGATFDRIVYLSEIEGVPNQTVGHRPGDNAARTGQLPNRWTNKEV